MTRPIVLGLTGSVGMGKSTTAAMFADLGVPVWDADATVHRLYGRHGAGTQAIARLAPEVIGPDGVDRARLRERMVRTPEILVQIESVIHPLVAEERNAFLEAAAAESVPLVLVDIPLLFETGAEEWLDKVLVVTAPAEIQRERVLARPRMDEAAFEKILARQLPDAEKRARADFIIDTSRGLDAARADVAAIVEELGSSSDA